MNKDNSILKYNIMNIYYNMILKTVLIQKPYKIHNKYMIILFNYLLYKISNLTVLMIVWV